MSTTTVETQDHLTQVSTQTPQLQVGVQPSVAKPIGAESVHSSLEVLSELYNYTHWLFNTVRPFVRGKVCEVGCGIGTVTKFMLNHERVVGVEPFTESLAQARKRFRDHLNVKIVQCTLADCPNDAVPSGVFDTVMCLNVLEHLEDDVASLRTMTRLCKAGGRVVVLVPAHMMIFGELDRSFGHYRRYNRRSLRMAFEAAGIKPTYSSYMNMLGFFGWGLQSRILKRKQITVESSRLFNRLVPFVDAFERIFKPLFGQSVMMVGKVTNSTPVNPYK